MIYFLQEDGNPSAPIKIGYTGGDPARRMGEIQTGYPGKLRILWTREGSEADEAREHRRWQRFHISGEWFKAASDLLEYIAEKSPPPEDDEREQPPDGECASRYVAWAAQKRHRSEIEALGLLCFLYPECGPFRWTGKRRACPRCWKWGWFFLGAKDTQWKDKVYVVWDGWPPTEPARSIGLSLTCVDIFGDMQRAVRPRTGCGYDQPKAAEG